MRFKKISWKNPLVLVVCFLIVVSVRFNRNDFLVKRNLGDAAFYIGNVEYLRGDKITYALCAPFNERLLVTVLAAPLPFSPMTSINVVNVLFLLLSIYSLYKLLNFFKLSERSVWAGLYMFVLSFPTFYYGTIGYIDSGVLLMIFVGTYAIYKEQPWIYLLAILLGTLAKEGIILLVPVAVAYAYSRNKPLWYGFAIAGLALYFLVWGAVKYYIPNSHGETPLLFWQPISWRLVDNLTRLHAYLSSILSFGIPGVLCLAFLAAKYQNVKAQWKQDLPLLTGFLGGCALWFYSIFSAHTDGRFFWVIYCFPVALCLIWWERYGSPFSKEN
jgi:hypothetical protein